MRSGARLTLGVHKLVEIIQIRGINTFSMLLDEAINAHVYGRGSKGLLSIQRVKRYIARMGSSPYE